MLDRAGSRHDASVDATLEALRGFDGPLLIDLDETLYLQNSTEDFIDTARPGTLALLVLKLLGAVKPWRWTGGEETRDVWRVGVVRAVFPWVVWGWRRRVSDLAARHANGPLLAAIQGRQPVIVTLGLTPVVAPLVAALGLPQARTVAARPWRFEDRSRGKLMLAVKALGEETVRASLVVTDSQKDLDVLDACARPLRTVWPGARFRRALIGIYCPGRYATLVKRPGAQFIRRSILQDELLLWVLASVFIASHPVLHILGLVFLSLSFWAIYEQGYVDNDLVAESLEVDPRLSTTFAAHEVATPLLMPWVWAAVSGAAAIALLRWPAPPTTSDVLAWLAVLSGTALWFRFYNRVDKATRVWLFAGLQLARGAAFAVLVPFMPVAAMAVGAHTLSRWVPYYLYRMCRDWRDIPIHLLRLIFFAILTALLALANGPGILADWSVPALTAFFAFKARRDAEAVFAVAHRLDRVSRKETTCEREAIDGVDVSRGHSVAEPLRRESPWQRLARAIHQRAAGAT